MSCSIIVDRKSQEPNEISKYELVAYRADVTGALGPLGFELALAFYRISSNLIKY